MSLIYDALKKAQVNLYKNKKEDALLNDRKDKSFINLKAVFIVILVLSLGIFLAQIFIIKIKGSKLILNIPAKKTPFTKQPVIFNTVAKNAQPDAATALVLKGIISDVNESLAIINDVILKKGESILGAVVTGIYPGRVDIVRENRKFSLYLQ